MDLRIELLTFLGAATVVVEEDVTSILEKDRTIKVCNGLSVAGTIEAYSQLRQRKHT